MKRLLFALLLALLFAGCGKPDKRQSPLFYIGAKNTPGVMTVGWTNSMLPTLHGGELVEVTAVDIANVPERAIIVTYWPAQGVNVIHRVIAIRRVGLSVGLVTKGDNVMTRDEHITVASDLVGLVTTINGVPVK